MQRKLWMLAIALLGLTAHGVATAQLYHYDGSLTICTGTCDSFASLGEFSVITGDYFINTAPSQAWAFANISTFNGQIFNPAAPLEGFDGTNPTTANPLPLVALTAPIRAAGGGLITGGTTDLNNELNAGTLLHEFVIPPFNSNGVWVIFDIGAGGAAQVQICLFFTTAGCIPGATQAAVFDGAFCNDLDEDGCELDSDSDGVPDDTDNCTDVANADQRDTDGDGIGNRCDADLNGDCSVNFGDLAATKAAFFSSPSSLNWNPDADFNGDNKINFIDLGILKATFFNTPTPGPGPSGLPNACSAGGP